MSGRSLFDSIVKYAAIKARMFRGTLPGEGLDEYASNYWRRDHGNGLSEVEKSPPEWPFVRRKHGIELEDHASCLKG